MEARDIEGARVDFEVFREGTGGAASSGWCRLLLKSSDGCRESRFCWGGAGIPPLALGSLDM